MRARTWFRSTAASALLAVAAGGCGGGSAKEGAGNACGPVFPTDPPSLAAMLGLVEARLVAAGRQDADFAAVFGADTDDVLAASDALQAQAVETAAADRMIPLPATPPAAVPDPATCGVKVSALTGSGKGFAGASFLASGHLLVAIDGDTGNITHPPLDITTTDPVSGNVTRVIHQETQVALSLSASHATAVVTLHRTINAWTSDGASLGSTSETATATIDVDFCPNESGVAAGMISLVTHGTASPASGAATTYQGQAMGAYKIHVNDMAETDSVDLDASIEFSATGGSSADIAATFSGAYTDTANVGRTLKGETKFQREDGSPADIGTMTDALYSTALLASTVAEIGAKKKWRSGACVEVRAAPGDELVDANAQIAVTATPFHKFKMEAIKAPVVATFSGTKSLDKVNMPVASPAMFTFVAGGKKGDQGVVSLKSTSNRGIGTGQAKYTVKCGGGAMDPMEIECKSMGQALNPDTCECECRLDPNFGNSSPNCRWTGTITVTEDDSGQLDEPSTGDHVTWSYDYRASLAPVDAVGTLMGAVDASWHRQDIYSSTSPDCTLTETSDARASGNADNALLLVGAAGSGMLTLIVRVPVSNTAPATMTATYTGSDCGGQSGYSSTYPNPLQLIELQGSGAVTGSTFAGSSVESGLAILPNGSSTMFKMTWNLTLVSTGGF